MNLNILFIVSKIVAYKCLINQIFNFVPQMLFVLQEYVTCQTYMYKLSKMIRKKDWKETSQNHLTPTLQFSKFSFPKIKVSSLHVEDFSKASQTQLSHSKST